MKIALISFLALFLCFNTAQLDFVYKNSDYYEKTYSRYPIARLVKDTPLKLK